MANLDIKQKIIASLGAFGAGQLSANALNLFQTLGYNTERQAPFDKPNYATFRDSFFVSQFKFHEEKALVKDWRYVDLLFQLSKEEIRKQISLFDTKKVDSTIIETYLFFAIALSKDQYSRTELSNITREVNHLFPMSVMILFKYGQFLTLAVINRRQHKRDESKDVLEKITLIKDIKIENPHRAHVEILLDLSFDKLQNKHGFTNFVELHNAWQKTLDTKELNKRFYQELANWYFWAMDYVTFPDDVEKNKDIRNATSLIRLITRIIFVWFIKEKGLVPEALFDRREMRGILKVFFKDKKSDSYYRAILQNLFFGTLNQRMNERGFAKDGSFLENKNNYGVKTLFRYASDFAVDEKEVLALFKDIPFLNGGLFDCLDKEDNQNIVVYGDGFSRNPKKQAVVPDFLFFGEEEDYDLNATYDTRNKRYKVKGLFNIFSAYKFTVAENTPVEEEIALDPELLGRVFENLLASYNPETKTTARKQTGSFYTPREIVNYMVDESLKAYLKQKLETDAAIKPEDAETGLEILFSYTEKEHAFTDRETKTLVDAIDNCKILDPACGSGAFPMGVLHKLVHVLHELDPQNAKWKERQISKARLIDDPSVREQSVAGIEEAFANNELDYGRKLYLIENCIYGVDIQPIAVQIAKLRFFISLVVDQKKNPVRKNLGILSLPNLETKFVAANTLIGLDKPQTGGQISFQNPEIEKLEDDLKALRHQYFNARTRREKLACQKKDRDLRGKISVLLEKDGWNKDAARSVAAFDPYDQNASSPFFDPEWMFGWREGFDVVIGNPPYGADIDDFIKLFERLYPKTSRGFKDIYKYFFNCSLEHLVNKMGILAFITPNTFLLQPRYSDLRAFLLEYRIKKLLNLGEDVFQAVVPTVISLVSANRAATSSNDVLFADISDSSKYPGAINKIHFSRVKQQLFLEAPNKIFTDNIRVKHDDEELLENILDFKDAGINYQRVNVGLADKGNSDLSQRLLYDGKREKESHFEYWKGTDISSYYIAPVTNRFVRPNIQLRDNERVILNSDYFKITPKLIWRQTASVPIAVVDNKGIWFGRSIQAGLINRKYSNKLSYEYLACLLNSIFVRKLYEKNVQEGGRVFPQVKLEKLKPIPIKIIFGESQSPFRILYKYVEFLKIESIHPYPAFLERIINAMVYEIYLPEEIKAADAEVLKHLTNLPELKDDWSDEQKLQTIEKAYKELSNPNHPVSIAMLKMDTIEEIRIIEGKQ